MPDDVLRPTTLTHAERLDRLAEVAIRVGVRLMRGQQLVVTAQLDAVPLVRRITEHAYRAGASLVTALYTDEVTRLARFRHGEEPGFDTAAGWLYDGMANAFRNGAARMAISGENPSLLAGENPDFVARANRANAKAYRGVMEFITSFSVNWNIVSAASPSWARAVFPDLPEEDAIARLWDAIFSASRVDGPDPVAAWEAHNAALHARTRQLTAQHFAALHFQGPGTDLTVGLADGHRWLGGSKPSKNGGGCNPNIPTEEVFTTPHKDRVDGTVSSTKPLSYQGTLIDGIRVKFANGRIVEAAARSGEGVLQRVLDTDEGARRLGEVALVPNSSPISQSGILFRNTLFDENAACHVALGQAYSTALEGADSLDRAGLAARGANSSLIHIDWMIGSGKIDVDGLSQNGAATPVMRSGEWVS